jgi:hypothetical protein
MWIEIRCDYRTSTHADGDGRSRCYSHDNEGPMTESSDNQKSILQAVRGLEQEGKETGWVKTRTGWVCPYCSKATESGASE